MGCPTATHLSQLFSAVPGPQPGSSSQLLPQPLSCPAAPQCKVGAGVDCTPGQTPHRHGGTAGGSGTVAWPGVSGTATLQSCRDGTDPRIPIKATVQRRSPVPYCTQVWAGLGAPFSLAPCTHSQMLPRARGSVPTASPAHTPLRLGWQRDVPSPTDPQLSPAWGSCPLSVPKDSSVPSGCRVAHEGQSLLPVTATVPALTPQHLPRAGAGRGCWCQSGESPPSRPSRRAHTQLSDRGAGGWRQRSPQSHLAPGS